MLANPRQQHVEGAAIIFQQFDQEPVCLFRIHAQFVTVKTQEDVGRKERNAFIPVHKRVIHDEGLEQRRRHPGKILVITGAGAVQSAFQQPWIADSRGATKAIEEGAVDFQRFVATEKGDGRYSASSFPSSSFSAIECSRWLRTSGRTRFLFI